MASTLALVSVLTVGGLAVRTAQLQQERDAETSQAQVILDLITDLDQPGARYAVLTDDGAAVGAIVVADGQRRVVTVGLDANPRDSSTYVLWGILPDAAAPEPIGTFDVNDADRGERLVGSDAEADEYATYAVSLEPGRTAPPTPSAVLASGEVRT